MGVVEASLERAAMTVMNAKVVKKMNRELVGEDERDSVSEFEAESEQGLDLNKMVYRFLIFSHTIVHILHFTI
jgi:hypothetical protein